MKIIEIESITEIDKAATEFIRYMQEENMRTKRVFAFHGEMGAGKTTFIKAICKALGVEDDINSPTFAIVNEYSSPQFPEPIYHFDFYRIEDIEEAYDMGCEDYLYGNGLCLIEWPEKISELLPEETVHISIEEKENGKRVVNIR